MIQLRITKVRVPWILLLFSVLFLISALVFLAMFLPAKRESAKLVSEISRVEKDNQNLTRVAVQRDSLVAKSEDLSVALAEQKRQLPTQYDLPEILEVMAQLSRIYGLRLADLSHVPLVKQNGEERGTIMVQFSLTGTDAILPYLEQLVKVLPTFEYSDISISYEGDGRFRASVEGELGVLLVDHAEASLWDYPELSYQADRARLRTSSFGLPFELVKQYLAPNTKVLGIVNSGSFRSALLSQGGTNLWLKPGERLGQAVVRQIQTDRVVLAVDSVLVELGN